MSRCMTKGPTAVTTNSTTGEIQIQGYETHQFLSVLFLLSPMLSMLVLALGLLGLTLCRLLV